MIQPLIVKEELLMISKNKDSVSPKGKGTHLNISVLLATYNRAEVLRQTLTSMLCLDRNDLTVEFVVVDNNSSDHTKEVVESFAGRLPIRYLFERRPGKNCALNRAIDEVDLGEIVVFTDDDVVPRDNWLQAIASISKRHPDCSVFGGKIYVVWPSNNIPDWAHNRFIKSFGFAFHDYANSESMYRHVSLPFGPNYWVRREVFSCGRRFNEAVGPRPKNRIMGSETTFLKQLSKDGYQIMFSPNAVVGHRILREQISATQIQKRAFRLGRSQVYLNGISKPDLFEKNPVFWYLLRVVSLGRWVIRYLTAQLQTSQDRRIEENVLIIYQLSSDIESLCFAIKKRNE